MSPLARCTENDFVIVQFLLCLDRVKKPSKTRNLNKTQNHFILSSFSSFSLPLPFPLIFHFFCSFQMQEACGVFTVYLLAGVIPHLH